MDIATGLGMIAGVIVLCTLILMGGSLGMFLDAHAAIVTSGPQTAAADEAYRVRAERYRQGQATALEMTAARLDLWRARLQKVDAYVDIRAAELRLEYAVGSIP